MEKMIYQGVCSGGPLNGTFGESRYSKGFLLVDKPNRWVWIYQWNPELEFFQIRNPDGAEMDDAGRWRAAQEDTYDVIAAPWEGEGWRQ